MAALYKFLMALLDGSLFVSSGDPKPFPMENEGNATKSAAPQTARLDEQGLEPDATAMAPPAYSAVASQPATSPAELFQWMAGAPNFATRRAQLEAYCRSPYSPRLFEHDVHDIVLKYGSTPSEKTALARTIGHSSQHGHAPYPATTLASLVAAMPELEQKERMLEALYPAVAVAHTDKSSILPPPLYWHLCPKKRGRHLNPCQFSELPPFFVGVSFLAAVNRAPASASAPCLTSSNNRTFDTLYINYTSLLTLNNLHTRIYRNNS
ncbi:uncharacterized protein MONBRDRAFT_27559 [Monosiga brevicollis MX1]|uniref:Uncharacterized protein n=1 Tax=Monosiga brevicollis TaxID=81824 RepID=A9V5M4_MONBE|nr:uncharacterized protein MONBRDRAFT_27559 [Monosiga brevicollis MX1]EDQ87144.1 predicted protein [Monosiga brevicollis MX1]|eukprot:XP_001748087.1 hypothetical protein [Monosiga brevicollis MX1]